MAVRNGYLPDSSLAVIPGTSRRILRALVPQTTAMRAAFQARFGKSLVVTDAYRDYAEQVALKSAKGAFAATPGTSNHGWGRALDLGSMVNIEGSPEYLWMKTNGPRFGWSHPRWAEDNIPANGQQEPWHWEAAEAAVPVSNYQTIGGTVPVIPTLPPLNPLEEDDMSAAGEAAILASLNNITEIIGVNAGGGIAARALEVKAAVAVTDGHVLTVADEVRAARVQIAQLAQQVQLLPAPDGAPLDVAGLAAQLVDAMDDGLATAVADELGKRIIGTKE